MRTYFNLAVLAALGVFILFVTSAFTEEWQPEKEVIVMFQDGVVTPPADKTTGTPDEFQIESEAMRQVLQDHEAQLLTKLMPDFQPDLITLRCGSNEPVANHHQALYFEGGDNR